MKLLSVFFLLILQMLPPHSSHLSF